VIPCRDSGPYLSAEAARVQAEGVRKRLEEFKELAEERRRLQETVQKQLEANSAGER